MRILERSFYRRNTQQVACELLGEILVHKISRGELKGRIVETEAYFGHGDPASHASKGKTPRASIMFGKPGVAYVYLNYGIHSLLNIVTEKEGAPGAVLIRALEPLSGLDIMMRNRRLNSKENLTNGPGKLTQALGIDLSYNGMDLTQRSSLFITDRGAKEKISIAASARIGISLARDELLRYYIEGNAWVSRK